MGAHRGKKGTSLFISVLLFCTTGPNKPFPSTGPAQSSMFNLGLGGLGGKPSNVTANPFGTPSTQLGQGTPFTQLGGLFRPSALGTYVCICITETFLAKPPDIRPSK